MPNRSDCKPIIRATKPSMRMAPSYALPLSREVVELVSSARAQAARQGSLFINPTHLLLGLLNCQSTISCQLLARAGINAAACQAEFDRKWAIPVNSWLKPADVDLSPQAREMLSFSQERAMEQESKVVDSSHMFQVLLHDRRSPLFDMLEQRGVEARRLEEQVLSSQTPEQPVASKPASQQAVELRDVYKKMKDSRSPAALSEAEYNDIYN
eukprot:CAMPEP_0119117008 /NCGR_PEP_ID=MMETSP1180-20130426/52599_1 /TAXON_ID=3052 ORGANISM="Chlamydomonas cf sp, Strain CCMP681" /NCGR_SAMPLE_ID=MMETSP1180 /ASSEMBLY_ACC=CAM_ASM_000741 /LENGTH=211 /DNA_ID=CAMNT_0007106215 /DNA_START=180 /DNA_END=815 /DNA_ORIENTATION=-